MQTAREVPFCTTCGKNAGVARRPNEAVRAHLVCPSCEHREVVLRSAPVPPPAAAPSAPKPGAATIAELLRKATP